jgi:hypothetical protein
LHIISVADLLAVLKAWRLKHGNETGCWVHTDEMQLLAHQIADLIQTPAPGEKIYQTISVSDLNSTNSR